MLVNAHERSQGSRAGRWSMLAAQLMLVGFAVVGLDAHRFTHNVLDDLCEERNLVEQHPEITKEMTRKLVAWHQSLPPDKGPELGAE